MFLTVVIISGAGRPASKQCSGEMRTDGGLWDWYLNCLSGSEPRCIPEEKLGRDEQETWGLGAGRGGGSDNAALGLAMGGAGRQGFRWQPWVDVPGREAIQADGREPAGIGGFCGADADQMSKVGD